MRSLALEGGRYLNPIRALPDPTKFEADMVKYIKQGKAKDDIDEDANEPTFDNEDDAEKAAKQKKKRGAKTVDSIPIYDRDAMLETWTSVLNAITLTMKKVDDAAGTRGSQKSQKDVMGFSASHVSTLAS